MQMCRERRAPCKTAEPELRQIPRPGESVSENCRLQLILLKNRRPEGRHHPLRLVSWSQTERHQLPRARRSQQRIYTTRLSSSGRPLLMSRKVILCFPAVSRTLKIGTWYGAYYQTRRCNALSIIGTHPRVTFIAQESVAAPAAERITQQSQRM